MENYETTKDQATGATHHTAFICPECRQVIQDITWSEDTSQGYGQYTCCQGSKPVELSLWHHVWVCADGQRYEELIPAWEPQL